MDNQNLKLKTIEKGTILLYQGEFCKYGFRTYLQ